MNVLPIKLGENIDSVSILQSRREFSTILKLSQEGIQDAQDFHVNRQILSGMIVDEKQTSSKSESKGYLQLRDGENQKPVFTFIVEEKLGEDLTNVIYRWLRIPKEDATGLVEEEHIYRGGMKKNRKDGRGEYMIISRCSDNTEKTKSIRGRWCNDILVEGVAKSSEGEENVISRNILHMKPKKRANPAIEVNKTIHLEQERLSKKKITSKNHHADSKEEVASILETLKFAS